LFDATVRNGYRRQDELPSATTAASRSAREHVDRCGRRDAGLKPRAPDRTEGVRGASRRELARADHGEP
jgi:hypothetical protein